MINKKAQRKKELKAKEKYAEKIYKRNKLIAEKKKDKALADMDYKFRRKIQPIKKVTVKDQVEEQILHNWQILQALEEESKAEEARRAQINESLEAEGHIDLGEKMKAIQEKLKKEEKE